MKLLLDECIPRAFKLHLTGQNCQTVAEMGWAGKKNGELLTLAESGGFGVFLTIDRGIEYQQNLSARGIAIILMRSKSSRLQDLLPHKAEILEALASIRTGQLIQVG